MSAKLKTYDLKLDRNRKVRLDLGALADAEEASGYNYLMDGVGKLTAKALAALVWASCKHEDPELTLDRVLGMVHAGNWHEVAETMIYAYAQAMPEPKAKAKKDDEGAEGND